MNGNNNSGNMNLGLLLAGIAMTAAGVYWLLSSIYVVTGFSGFHIGRITIGSGLVLVPFIVGVVMMFRDYKSFYARLVLFGGFILILASIIMNTRFIFRGTSLFNLLLMIVLICGGIVSLIKAVKG